MASTVASRYPANPDKEHAVYIQLLVAISGVLAVLTDLLYNAAN